MLELAARGQYDGYGPLGNCADLQFVVRIDDLKQCIEDSGVTAKPVFQISSSEANFGVCAFLADRKINKLSVFNPSEYSDSPASTIFKAFSIETLHRFLAVCVCQLVAYARPSAGGGIWTHLPVERRSSAEDASSLTSEWSPAVNSCKCSFVPQTRDRVKIGGHIRRVVPEKQPNAHGDRKSKGNPPVR